MRVIETLSLSIWVGTMAAFAFIFAPIAFHTIPDLTVFALLVAKTVTAITYLGYGCGALMLVSLLATQNTRSRNIRLICLAAMLLSATYELYAILPLMQHMLAGLGAPLSALPLGDSRRIAYDALHRRSSSVYGVTLLSGLIALVLRVLDIPSDRTTGHFATGESDVGLA